jgi:hypothetical protein
MPTKTALTEAKLIGKVGFGNGQRRVGDNCFWAMLRHCTVVACAGLINPD